MLTKEAAEPKDSKKVGKEEEIGPVFIDKQIKRGLTKLSKWKKEAKEDYNFAIGDQWSEEEKSILRNEGRPCMTYNKIEPLLDLVGGYERENSARIKVNPEGGEDKIFSEVMDMILKAIDKWTKLGYKLDHAFDDGIACGKGWVEMGISYDDDILHGDMVFKQLVPWQVIPDPDGTEYDQSDWNCISKISRLTRSRLKYLYPNKENEIDGITDDTFSESFDVPEKALDDDGDNYHNGKGLGQEFIDGGESECDDKFWLKEYWHKKKIKKFVVFHAQENRFTRFDTEDAANAEVIRIQKDAEDKFHQAQTGHQALMMNRVNPQMAQMTGVDPNTPEPQAPIFEKPEVRIFIKWLDEMRYAACVSNIMLVEDTKSPFEPYYHGFPIFNFYAKYRPSVEKEELKIKGLVRNLKDPQRDINKSKSQFLHILNTSANSGWVGDDQVLSPEGWSDLKTMGSTPGVVIRKIKEGELTRIQPTGVSQGQLERMSIGFQDLKECSGINSDALAMQDKDTSGRAIALRIKQAVTILSPEFRNFRWTKEMIGTAIFSMIPHIFDVDSVKKVIGQSYITSNALSDGMITAILQQVADGKYDIEITEADNSATIRAEIFDDLMQMASKGMAIPPDVILSFSNIPNLKEVTDKINAYAQQMANAQANQGGQTPRV